MSAVMSRRPRMGAAHVYGLVAIGIATLALFFALNAGNQPCAQAASGTCPVGDTKTVSGDFTVAGGALTLDSDQNQDITCSVDQTAGRTCEITLLDTGVGYGTIQIEADVVIGGSQKGLINFYVTDIAGGGSDVPRMTIKHDGKVGIGETAPDEKLEVNGNGHVTGYWTFDEMTAPSGAANTARLYAVDNGAGKTQLCVIFPTGSADCFSTEP